jgi:hypothetical protein
VRASACVTACGGYPLLFGLCVTDFLFLVWIAAAPGIFLCLTAAEVVDVIVEMIVNAMVGGGRWPENVDFGHICSSWILCCFPERV